MSRRGDRRTRIDAAFEEFRQAAGAALSAAAAAREATQLEHAQTMFEMWLRAEGLDTLAANPSFERILRNPRMAPPLNRMLADRRATFGDWVTTEPPRLVELVADAAPGAAGDQGDGWLGEVGKVDGGGPIPQLWRVGSAVVDGAPRHQPFPVAVPLLDDSHLEIITNPGTQAAAEALIENLLMRVVSYFRPGMIALHAWDVGQVSGATPGLYPLTRSGVLTVHHPGRLSELLEELSDHIRRVHNRILIDGHPSLRALSAATGSRTEPWQVAVLIGGGQDLRDDDRRTLQRVARNGLACGIQLILVDMPVAVSAPMERLTLIEPPRTWTGPINARSSMTGTHATVTLDAPLPREQVTAACHAISDELERVRSRIGRFGDLMPLEPRDWWQASSVTGVHAPVGFRDGLVIELALCDSSPHALIGGPSGSGKTNLLFTMIGSMAARYSPDELELYLLDFKEGVSFAQFTPGRRDPTWLPHARLVGVNINTDREFGLALLRFLAGEMRRRAEAAKSYEVTKLEELRTADPEGRWPRIVAVIDEFQYLFAEKDGVTREAVMLLEDVARRGRSQGIHLVLSSQDVSGIEAFWGRPAIFEQFVLRVALPRSRRVLAELNDAALSLPRWHAVLNHESGIKHGNEVIRIPDATAKGTLDKLQAELWEMRPEDLPEPRLFDADRSPRLADLLDDLPPGPAPMAVLGQLMDVAGSSASVPMAATPGRNLAVISSAVPDAASVLGAAAWSLARQHAPGQARFTLVTLVPDASAPVDELAARLVTAGHTVTTVGLDGMAALIGELAADTTGRLTGGEARSEPHYLLLYGVDGASGVLEQKNPETFRSGLDSLRQVLKSGPETGLHVLGWWRSVQRLRAVLTMGAGVDDIGCWVAFDVQGAELGTLAPGLATWSPRPARGLMFDRYTQQRPEVMIVPDIS
ncbi:FtsK/SpoIIIE domain-containing protein [Pseudonocardia spinosispora]|uniref:FtsK/SpoIIIE domain-containing protein n=1 Tax=Pseudonocardia spinosispora TaxID=103441 RepID=UPI0004095403|nr:FtsK/SpoIIIE domain-containing protein [Pseudonocardia spinosispora]